VGYSLRTFPFLPGSRSVGSPANPFDHSQRTSIRTYLGRLVGYPSILGSMPGRYVGHKCISMSPNSRMRPLIPPHQCHFWDEESAHSHMQKICGFFVIMQVEELIPSCGRWVQVLGPLNPEGGGEKKKGRERKKK
jgi:hypothetical protein